MFEGGVNRVVLGTVAYTQPDVVRMLSEKYPDRILSGVDASNGYLAIKGWKDVTRIRADEFCRQWKDSGIRGIIYTDIKQDGTMKGPNIDAISRLLDEIDIPLIAAGGISRMLDLKALSELEPKGLEGVIIGRALYTGAIDLGEAIAKWQTPLKSSQTRE